MSLCQWLVLAVVVQRLLEVAYARRNVRRLRAQGAREVGAAHYPLFFVLHGAWLVSLWWLVPADAAVTWLWLGVFALLQLARLWAILSLGRFWTTRVFTLDGAPLVRQGPYRYLRHPNYLIVTAEIAVLPLAFGAVAIAAVFSVANGALLWHRIGVEDEALRERRRAPSR